MKWCSSANTCNGPRRNCCAFAHSCEELRAPAKARVQDKKVLTWIVNNEQPQFFVPLTFVSFKDSAQKPAQPMPHTPSPRAYHRDIPAEESASYRTEQALQLALQNEQLCPQPSAHDQCNQVLLPNQGDMPCMNIPSSMQIAQANPQAVQPVRWNYQYDAEGNMHMWPETPQQQGAPTRCCFDSEGNMHIWPETQQQSNGTSTRCCFDSQGNMHVWPESSHQRTLCPTPQGGMIDLSSQAAACKMTGPRPNDPLRSDSMHSWGSSTTTPSMASHKSYADSLRSESIHSWMSSSASVSGSTSITPHVVPPRPGVGVANHSTAQKTSILGLFKEKLKPKSK